jgi:hypothetical protein
VLVDVRPALRFEEVIMTRWGLAAAGRAGGLATRRAPFLFETSVEAAVAKAQLAGDRDVHIAGATVTRGCLDAGLPGNGLGDGWAATTTTACPYSS